MAGTGGGVTMAVTLWRATVTNQLVEDVSDLLVDGRVEMNLDRATKLAASLTVRDADRINPYTDYLAPILTLAYDDGRPSVTAPLGLYAFEVPPGQRTIEDATAAVAGQDLTSLLTSSAYQDANNVASGTNALSELAATLAEVGITRTNLPASSTTLAATTTFPVGTTRYAKGQSLTTYAGCYDPYMELDGRIATQPIRDIAAVQPYATLTDDDLLAPVEVQPTKGTIANVVVVVQQDPSLPFYESVARNDDPASPTSTATVGREFVRVEKRTDLAAQADADALAARLLAESRSFYQVVTAKTFFDPNIGLHQTVALNLSGKLSVLNGRWWVRTWAFGLRPAAAVLTLEINRVTDDILGTRI